LVAVIFLSGCVCRRISFFFSLELASFFLHGRRPHPLITTFFFELLFAMNSYPLFTPLDPRRAFFRIWTCFLLTSPPYLIFSCSRLEAPCSRPGRPRVSRPFCTSVAWVPSTNGLVTGFFFPSRLTPSFIPGRKTHSPLMEGWWLDCCLRFWLDSSFFFFLSAGGLCNLSDLQTSPLPFSSPLANSDLDFLLLDPEGAKVRQAFSGIFESPFFFVRANVSFVECVLQAVSF